MRGHHLSSFPLLILLHLLRLLEDVLLGFGPLESPQPNVLWILPRALCAAAIFLLSRFGLGLILHLLHLLEDVLLGYGPFDPPQSNASQNKTSQYASKTTEEYNEDKEE